MTDCPSSRTKYTIDCEWSLILVMAIMRRAKYTRTHARTKISPNSVLPSRRVSSKFRARVCVYFARPTIAINKIRDHSQSKYTNGRILRLYTRRTTRRITRRNKHCLLKFIPDGWYKTGRYIFTQHCSCNAVLPSHNRVDIKFCITIQSFYAGGCSVEKLSKWTFLSINGISMLFSYVSDVDKTMFNMKLN